LGDDVLNGETLLKMVSSHTNPDANLTQTVLKALDVLECVAEAGRPVSAQEVARLCRTSRPTAYRLLTTLLARGYLVLAEEGTYTLGTRILNISQRLLKSLDLFELSKPDMYALSEATNETIHLAILDGAEMLYINKVESSQSVRMHSTVGSRNPLYCTAMGKAVLAYLPEEERDWLLDRISLAPRTPQTITARTALLEHLDQVRCQGFAIDDVESEEGVRCVGAPIFNHTGRVIASVSVSGPAYRQSVTHLLELAPLVVRAAGSISSRLGYSLPGETTQKK
jgi:DNA-binding IclR family transcriptional regulator